MATTRSFLFILLTVIFFSCNRGVEKKDVQELKDTILSDYDSKDWVFGGKAFGIFHEVRDFEKWQTSFKEEEDRRDEAGFEQLDILFDVENDHLLAVFFKTKGHQRARDFISDGLRERMDEAGVISDPSFIMYDLVFMTNQDYDSIPYRVGASYKVKDFEEWLEKFTANRKEREKLGLKDIGVARSPEAPRMVYMMMTAKTIEQGQKFIEDEKKRMDEYGVTGDPSFSIWKRAEFRNSQPH